ncbi:LLM class flavin-dependent oxidoreductase [Frankia sp. Cppng1_Ct_nod]|uniref:LLM class flavin-dependent oxidoreductase n=1 Tax=Frankia sp. Cppng1_Ct_nod TaxID=2897162 RepID=UPI0010410283|nr:LLM class flavin-dependent oxidoreductase [Frankia sp. Cppng1_Ct_nod]
MPSENPVPLSVLDLVPLTSGSSAVEALRNTIDLAQQVERFGYARYWLAEHHLTPSVASAAPAVLIALVSDATRRIRVGSGAVQTAYQTPVVIAEQFGTIAHIHPGRIDLGLGRSSVSKFIDKITDSATKSTAGQPATSGLPASRPCVVDGLPIPARPKFLFDPHRLRRQLELVGYRDAADDDYTLQVRAIQAFIRGDYRTHDGMHLRTPTAEGTDMELWIVAASAGESARTAGKLGLPMAANYHSMPTAVLDTVRAYRAAFRPSETMREPHVMVSADVVVADDDEIARRLASGYGPWAGSIRRGEGVTPYLTPAEAASFPWTEQDRALVADRVDTQFVGSPTTVVRGLRTLRDVTGADELLITTVTHDHAARVRSYELLAQAWARPG